MKDLSKFHEKLGFCSKKRVKDHVKGPGIMLPSIFEKLKMCSNRTKSLVIVN